MNPKTLAFIGIIILVVITYYFINNNTMTRVVSKITEQGLKYFKFEEFDSPAVQGIDTNVYTKGTRQFVKDSGLQSMDKDFIKRLDNARDEVETVWNKYNPTRKIVFLINSALRTPHYNVWLAENTNYQVATNSPHKLGKAVDISVSAYDPEQREVIIRALRNQGFERFGIANTFIHVDSATDVTGHATPRKWVYSGLSPQNDINPFNIA